MQPLPFRVDFWRFDRNQAEVAAICERLNRAPPDDRRWNRNLATNVLAKFKADGEYWIGDAYRARLSEAAVIGDDSGQIRHADLKANEGPAEETAFLIWPKHSALLIQRSRSGVTCSALSDFLVQHDSVSPGRESFDLHPIVTNEAMKRLATITRVTRIDIQLRGKLTTHAGSESTPLNEILRLAGIYEAKALKLSLNVGYDRDSGLQKKQAKALAKAAEGLPAGVELRELTISGLTDEDKRDVLDLIEERVTYESSIEPDERRGLAFKKRVAALKTALHENLRHVE